ncbi:hypothetical protein DENSPDRAFT_883582 [Dentipellis sp. KUC8613]|nr:hypothetical protein DENSPDRAFT_883582 [Dentipellis sp. KUC8613]
MSLICLSLGYREHEWEDRAQRVISALPSTLSAGLVAYAREQKVINQSLAASFRKSWAKVLPLADAVINSAVDQRTEDTVLLLPSNLPASRNIDAEYLEDIDLGDDEPNGPYPDSDSDDNDNDDNENAAAAA